MSDPQQQPPPPPPEKWLPEKWLNLIERLNVKKVLLAALAWFGSIALVYISEHRETALPAMWQNQWAFIFLIVASVLFVIGFIGSWLIGKVESAKAEVTTFLLSELKLLRADHQRCTLALDELQRRQRQTERVLRANQLDEESGPMPLTP